MQIKYVISSPVKTIVLFLLSNTFEIKICYTNLIYKISLWVYNPANYQYINRNLD